MDEFEKRINSQRDELDSIESLDKAKLWKNIQSNSEIPSVKPVQKKPKIAYLKWYAIAASLLLLIAGWMVIQNQQLNINIEFTQSDIELPPEIAQEENQYKRLVADKMEAININAIDSTAYSDIFYELKLLEEIHQEFRVDFPAIENNEKLLKLLKKYYERKIRILDRLSKEIEKKSYHEKRNNKNL